MVNLRHAQLRGHVFGNRRRSTRLLRLSHRVLTFRKRQVRRLMRTLEKQRDEQHPTVAAIVDQRIAAEVFTGVLVQRVVSDEVDGVRVDDVRAERQVEASVEHALGEDDRRANVRTRSGSTASDGEERKQQQQSNEHGTTCMKSPFVHAYLKDKCNDRYTLVSVESCARSVGAVNQTRARGAQCAERRALFRYID